MRRDAQAEGRRWLDQAVRDLDDARFNAAGKRFNVACFLCQQAAEKAVKGYLYAKGAESVWGHGVAELCDDAAQLDASFHVLRRRAGGLDKYYIPTRYPNGLPSGLPADAFSADDACLAIGLAEELIEHCRQNA